MNKIIKSLVRPFALVATSLIIPASAFAVAGGSNLVPTELSKTADIVAVIQAIIKFILIVAFVIAFVMLLIGGIRWILAGGDEKAVGAARNTITAALIGLVIVLVAFALIKLVETFFGVTIISGNVEIPHVQ